MILIRHPNGSEPSVYEVNDTEPETGRSLIREIARKPHIWSWNAGRGGISALARTKEEAELMLRDQFWQGKAA